LPPPPPLANIGPVTHEHGVEPVVRDDPDNHRYVLEIGGEVAGIAVYHRRGGRYFFVHTEVEPEHEGEGLGSTLARGALDDVREMGMKIVPLCPFITSFIERHPEYADMVDQPLLERINQRD
jgi:predicted GNAT family acetyltransferase